MNPDLKVFLTTAAVASSIAYVAVKLLSPKPLPRIPHTDPMEEVTEMLKRHAAAHEAWINSPQVQENHRVIDEAYNQMFPQD